MPEEETGPPPPVSVLMAARNEARFVGEALDDLLGQSFAEFELVVVDDGSTDATPAILAERAARDPRLVVLRNPENLGLPAALNRGLARCRAPLVARADADDRYARDRLERQVRFLEAHPEVGLLSCAFHTIDEDGAYLFTTYPPTTDGAIRLRELLVNCFTHPGVVFRRDLVQALGGYDTAYPTSQDADLWARLRRQTRAAILPEPLVRYRRHARASMARRGPVEKARSFGVRQRLLADYLGRPVDLAETVAMQALFLSRHPVAEPAALAAGLSGLREILRAARGREAPADLRHFRRDVAEGLTRQARLAAGRPARCARLLAEALRWDPATPAGRLAGRLGLGRPAASMDRVVLPADAR